MLYRSESCDALLASDNDAASSLKSVVYRAEYINDGDDEDDDDWDPSISTSGNGSSTAGRFKGETTRRG